MIFQHTPSPFPRSVDDISSFSQTLAGFFTSCAKSCLSEILFFCYIAHHGNARLSLFEDFMHVTFPIPTVLGTLPSSNGPTCYAQMTTFGFHREPHSVLCFVLEFCCRSHVSPPRTGDIPFSAPDDLSLFLLSPSQPRGDDDRALVSFTTHFLCGIE